MAIAERMPMIGLNTQDLSTVCGAFCLLPSQRKKTYGSLNHQARAWLPAFKACLAPRLRVLTQRSYQVPLAHSSHIRRNTSPYRSLA